MIRAALYLRSSKDRSDVSIDAQRRELRALADAKGFIIVKEFSDVVESAKTENRPAFQLLLSDLKNDARGWDHLLLTDTSRLSRRQYMAHVFDHECAKRRVTVIYSKLPNVDELTNMVVKSVLRVFDEFHSHMSRAKGLAGMAENVRRGYRAGGRAPRGYRLEHIATGAIRDGIPVMKSHLVLSMEASNVRAYLNARVMGRPRRAAALAATMPGTGLVDLEWNALTYAGCTVWNMRSPYLEGVRQGRKRRPRSEWVIQEGTHEALIGRDDAERLLSRLENRSEHNYRCRESAHVLAGVLRTPAGIPWNGWGRRRYQTIVGGRRRSIKASTVDTAVLARIREDLLAPAFISALVVEAQNTIKRPGSDAIQTARRELREFTRRISVLVDMATETMERGPIMRKIEECEGRRQATEAEIARLEREARARTIMTGVSEDQVRRALEHQLSGIQRQDGRGIVGRMVERVILDPETLECRIRYRIAVVRDKMASPAGVEPALPP